MRFITRSAEETELLGEYVFCRFRRYRTFLIYGDMGSGKTTFARGFVRGAGYEEVRSPTFTMITVYPTPVGRIHHADLYRLRGEEDFYTLGLLDVVERETVLVEWPEKLPVRLKGVEVRITMLSESVREVSITPP